MQREVKPAGVTQAINTRHPNLSTTFNVAEREIVSGVPFVRKTLGIFRLAGHIAASSKPLVGSRKAHRVEFGLPIGPDRCALERPIHVLSERVATFDAVDTQMKCSAAHFRND